MSGVVDDMTRDPEEGPVPAFIFSADRLKGRDRFDAWQHEVAQLFNAAPAGEAPAFEAKIAGYMLDGILVASTSFSEQTYHRDRRLVAHTGLDAYLVQLYTDGGFDGYADAAEMSVRAGDICVFDMTETLSTRAVPSSNINLVIPKVLVDQHWTARAPVNGTVIFGSAGLGQVLGAHLAALHKAMPTVSSAEAPLLASSAARLIADSLTHCSSGGGTAHGALRQALFERATDHIRTNIRSPDLSPETICRALNVSRPHLYRAFQAEGGIMRSIQDHRLRLAYAELADPLNRAETIGSVAYGCGFASDSHFTRLFREAFGVRPTDVRDGGIPRAANVKPSLATWLSSPTFIRK